MGIYMIYLICFITPFVSAFSEGRKAGIVGIAAGLVVGLALGTGAVFAIRALFQWVVRHPHLGERFPTPVWIIVDTLLVVTFMASLVGLALLAHVITQSAIRNVAT